MAPTLAAAAAAAPGLAMLPRVLLASPAGQPSLPDAQHPTAQLETSLPATATSGDTLSPPATVAPGPNVAQLVGPADVSRARAQASVSPAAGDGGKGGGGLGAKTIGIVAGAVAAAAVVLSKHPPALCVHTGPS